MVRFLVLYDTPADPEAFDRHYRDVHIPLAKQLPGLRRYTVSRNHGAVRGDQSYYLVAELDWDDMAALKRDFASELGQETAGDVERLAELCPGVHSMVFELQDL
jgi:uncharacterized protein (TIGR02118 family)